MNAIQSFQFNQQPIQVINKNGEAWFIAAEVAAVFGYLKASDLTRVLDDDEKGTHNMRTLGGNQDVSIINESGLYHAAFKSRKESVKQFRKWVTAEVLPTIRQTGRYELHLDRWLTEWEREQIRKAVKERCGRTGETSQAVYAKLHRFMDVPSYEQIGATQFQTALNFLASIQDAPEVFRQPQAARFDDMEIARLATVVYYCNWACRLLEEVNEPLRALGYGKAVTMWTVANESGSFLKASREVLERELPNISDGYCRDHIQGSLRRFDAVQAV